MRSPDKAIEEYRKALSYRPNYGEAYSGLGDAYLTKGMTQEAVKEYKNAVRVLPVSALISVPAYNNLAYIYAEEEHDLDEALSLAQKAKRLLPNHPDVADTVGWISYKKGLYDEAVANLKAAVKGSPDNPIIRYHLGAAYYKQGARDEAAAELKKALEIDDKFEGVEDAKRLLAELED
jgi:Flp pilus assembly protein TadD